MSVEVKEERKDAVWNIIDKKDIKICMYNFAYWYK